MGAGTITMPYIVSLTGIGLGMVLIVAGAFANAYASSLLVSVTSFVLTEYSGLLCWKDRQEDVWRFCWGSLQNKKCALCDILLLNCGIAWIHYSIHKPRKDIDSKHYSRINWWPYWIQILVFDRLKRLDYLGNYFCFRNSSPNGMLQTTFNAEIHFFLRCCMHNDIDDGSTLWAWFWHWCMWKSCPTIQWSWVFQVQRRKHHHSHTFHHILFHVLAKRSSDILRTQYKNSNPND